MQLFKDIELREYLKNETSNLKRIVENMTDEQIIDCDFQKTTNNLINNFHISLIIIYFDQIEESIKEVKIKKYNQFHRFDFEDEYIYI